MPSDCFDNPEFNFGISCRDRLVGDVKDNLNNLGVTGLTLAAIEVDF